MIRVLNNFPGRIKKNKTKTFLSICTVVSALLAINAEFKNSSFKSEIQELTKQSKIAQEKSSEIHEDNLRFRSTVETTLNNSIKNSSEKLKELEQALQDLKTDQQISINKYQDSTRENDVISYPIKQRF